jgi:hypothetical protein
MINFLVYIVLTFKPVHMMQDDLPSCGATERFLKEKVQITIEDGDVKTGSVKWNLSDTKIDGYYVATHKADPNAYMSMSLWFDEVDGYMTIEGIDAKRKPCRDTVYFVRE